MPGATFREVSRGRLIFNYAIAHVPAIVLLVLTWIGASQAMPLCNMQLLFSDALSPICAPVLTKWVALLCIVIGAVSWRIAFELKVVCWGVATLAARALGLGSLRLASEDDLSEQRPYTLATFTAFMRSLVTEALRLLSLALCVAVVVAIAWGQREKTGLHVSTMSQCWIDVDDPRFILTLWVGSGWTIAEVVSGSWQILRFLPLLRTVSEVMPQEVDVLEDYVGENNLGVPNSHRSRSPRSASNRSPSPGASDLSDNDLFLASECSMAQENLSTLVLLREKEELEAQLGEPLENLSPATIALWRIDSVIWNLATCVRGC